MTIPEKLLWGKLRSGRLCGLKFRRQHPLGPYVLDFFCLSENLALELDGDSHAGRADYDKRRTEYIESQSVRVFRIHNDDVIRDLDNVLEGILLACGISLDGKSSPGQPSLGSPTNATRRCPEPPPRGERGF